MFSRNGCQSVAAAGRSKTISEAFFWLKMSNAEVVYCKCGVMIAACVIGYQSAQWHKDLRKYMKDGYAVKHVPSSEVKLDFGSCTCVKSNPSQLDLFKD